MLEKNKYLLNKIKFYFIKKEKRKKEKNNDNVIQITISLLAVLKSR